MKALKITQALKILNPILNLEVGKYYVGEIPKKFKRPHEDGFINHSNYDKKEDLQLIDGWEDIVTPNHDAENEKITSEVIEIAGKPTYKKVALTQAEKDARDLITMPPRDFKLALLNAHGIGDPHLHQFFDHLLTQPGHTFKSVETMRTMWANSASFHSSTPELFSLANAAAQYAKAIDPNNNDIDTELTEADIQKIFTDYAGV